MIKKAVSTISFLIFCILTSSAMAQPFTISNTLANRWTWVPAEGTPTQYMVEKFTSGVWNVAGMFPSASATLISPSTEIYKIRVTAIDAAGNIGPTSPDSKWCLVFTETPGRAIPVYLSDWLLFYVVPLVPSHPQDPPAPEKTTSNIKGE